MAALYGSGAIGGVINLISRQGHEPGSHFTGDLAGGYPQQILGNVDASGIEGPFDYAATFEGAVAARLRRDAAARCRSTPACRDGFRDQIGTLNLGYTPVEGTRLSLFLRARQRDVRLQRARQSHLRQRNSTGHETRCSAASASPRSCSAAVTRPVLFLGRLQDDRHYTESLNPLDPNQASNDSRYHGYRTDLQWNNTVHLDRSDRRRRAVRRPISPSATSTSPTTSRCRVNSVLRSASPFAQNAKASYGRPTRAMPDCKRTLWNRLTLTGQIRQDWVADNAAVHLAARRGVRRAGDRDALQGGVRHRVPRAVAVRPLRRRFLRLCRQPESEAGEAQGWELGFTTDVPAFGQSDFASFGATYFNNQVSNLIVTPFTPVYTAVNIGSAHIQGVETELTLRPARWLTVTGRLHLHRARKTPTPGPRCCAGRRIVRRLNAASTPLPGLTDRAGAALHRAVPGLPGRRQRVRHRHEVTLEAGADRQPHRHLPRDAARAALRQRAQPVLLAVRAGERLPDARAAIPFRDAVERFYGRGRRYRFRNSHPALPGLRERGNKIFPSYSGRRAGVREAQPVRARESHRRSIARCRRRGARRTDPRDRTCP